MFNRKYIFKGSIFHCYVRLPECSCLSPSPKDHWTLQWKGLNLYSRVWVLKIASFEGSGYLGSKNLFASGVHDHFFWDKQTNSMGACHDCLREWVCFARVLVDVLQTAEQWKYIYGCLRNEIVPFQQGLQYVWANYNDLSRGHLKWRFSKGVPPKSLLIHV